MENREIKFRAWHLPTKKMFEVYSLCPNAVFENSMDGVHTSATLPAEREDCVLQQFTSLKDKNGVDIYEGDIVKTNYGKMGVVKFHKERASFIINDNEHFNCQLFQEMPYLEIIGNIYENPELLNTK